MPAAVADLLDSGDPKLFDIITHGPGPVGRLPITESMLLDEPSGIMFGLTQAAGMGWDPAQLGRPQYLILSTQGGLRGEDGKPIALGYHTGHWEVGLLVRAAAEELNRIERLPFAAYVSDPCDGRSQGTAGMMDSLPYRNDAAVVLRRLIRSMPTRKGVIGVATCDKGLPAMMLALAAQHNLPGVIVPGGVTLPADDAEDAAKVQTLGVRYAHGSVTLDYAAEAGCKSCGSSGGGCQFMGTAGTSQVVAEGFGLALPHTALAPSGQAIWLDGAKRAARAVVAQEAAGITMKDVLTEDALHNAMVVHAACGGSTNLVLHIPAIAFAAGLKRPKVEDWNRINRQVPRLVDVLPNGPVGHWTIWMYLAGGVPEVMLHLRDLGLLKLNALTATGQPLGEVLDWWQQSERRATLRKLLQDKDGINPDDVIMSADRARSKGLTSTVCFPMGNIAPEGSVIKATAIDPTVVDGDGVYRKLGPAKVFNSERAAVAAVKGRGDKTIEAGDVIVVMCRGPLGSGMEETYQLTSALKYVPFGKTIALITDARFSGVSTGACIGHVGPEALAGGPIGKLRDGDMIEIIIDRNTLDGSLNLVGDATRRFSWEEGAKILAAREPSLPLVPDPQLPDDTRIWAMLQQLSGGTWGGCVYDADALANLVATRRG